MIFVKPVKKTSAKTEASTTPKVKAKKEQSKVVKTQSKTPPKSTPRKTESTKPSKEKVTVDMIKTWVRTYITKYVPNAAPTANHLSRAMISNLSKNTVQERILAAIVNNVDKKKVTDFFSSKSVYERALKTIKSRGLSNVLSPNPTAEELATSKIVEGIENNRIATSEANSLVQPQMIFKFADLGLDEAIKHECVVVKVMEERGKFVGAEMLLANKSAQMVVVDLTRQGLTPAQLEQGINIGDVVSGFVSDASEGIICTHCEVTGSNSAVVELLEAMSESCEYKVPSQAMSNAQLASLALANSMATPDLAIDIMTRFGEPVIQGRGHFLMVKK